MSSPIPCSQCGNLFMRKDLTLDAPRLCNNCEYAALKKMSTKLEKVEYPKESVVVIEIECSHQMASEIEEICMNLGISFSDYFIKIYRFFSALNPVAKELHGVSSFYAKGGYGDSTIKNAIKTEDFDKGMSFVEKYEENLKAMLNPNEIIIPPLEEKSQKTHKKKVKK